ncbi:hypothetical protein LINPERHAP2_LOCUS30683 [Linum perenne]
MLGKLDIVRSLYMWTHGLSLIFCEHLNNRFINMRVRFITSLSIESAKFLSLSLTVKKTMRTANYLASIGHLLPFDYHVISTLDCNLNFCFRLGLAV